MAVLMEFCTNTVCENALIYVLDAMTFIILLLLLQGFYHQINLMLCHFVECICEGMLKNFFETTLRQQKHVEQFESFVP